MRGGRVWSGLCRWSLRVGISGGHCHSSIPENDVKNRQQQLRNTGVSPLRDGR